MNIRTEPAETAMEVIVNGGVQALVAFSTLADLIACLGLAPDKVATAVNGEFVAHAQRDRRVLHAGDEVTCFQAITGG